MACQTVQATTHHVSKVVCLFEWFVTVLLSDGIAGALFDALFSRNVPSGRGDGTEQRNTKIFVSISAKAIYFYGYFPISLAKQKDEEAVTFYVCSL